MRSGRTGCRDGWRPLMAAASVSTATCGRLATARERFIGCRTSHVWRRKSGVTGGCPSGSFAALSRNKRSSRRRAKGTAEGHARGSQGEDGAAQLPAPGQPDDRAQGEQVRGGSAAYPGHDGQCEGNGGKSRHEREREGGAEPRVPVDVMGIPALHAGVSGRRNRLW